MVSTLERRTRTLPEKISQWVIPIQMLRDVETQRIYSRHSLNPRFLEENMRPNIVKELRLEGKRWVMIAPHGGYTPTEHVMFMRWVLGECTPDPVGIPSPEGEMLMPIAADVVKWISERPYNEKVVFGYHSSPISVDQDGCQSVLEYHPYVFGLPSEETSKYVTSIDSKTLDRKDKKALRGGFYNYHFGRFLIRNALNGDFIGDKEILNQLFAIEKADSHNRGITIPTRESLEDILRTPGFFEGFLKPFAISMRGFTDDLSRAFTNLDPDFVRRRIEEAVVHYDMLEEEREAILKDVTKIPELLKKSERARNIQLLQEKGYSEEFVNYLNHVNKRLPESGDIPGWKRGFGYTLAIHENKTIGECYLAINTVVESGPAGVVEGVLGAKLVRPKYLYPQEVIARKREDYRELAAHLDSHVA